MHTKYQDVLEYFRESRMLKEIQLTLVEFQSFDIVYQEMLYYLELLDFKRLDLIVVEELKDQTKKSIQNQHIIEIANKVEKEVVVYLSMAFGNPYGDPWHSDLVVEWTQKMSDIGVKTLSLSDTIGQADPKVIVDLFQNLIPKFPFIEFGAHFHTQPSLWFEKVDAAYKGGCRRFDGAIMGYGGCPMAKDELTGNMPTEKLLSYFTSKKDDTQINSLFFESAYNEAIKIFT